MVQTSVHAQQRLISAIANGASTKMLLAMMAQSVDQLQDTDKLGRLPLHLALESTSLSQDVEFIAQCVAAYPAGAAHADAFGRLPLHYAAIKAATLPVVENLVRVYPAAAAQVDKMNRPPLAEAIMKTKGPQASEEVILYLVEHCPSAAGIPDKDGDLPLHIALYNVSSLAVVRALLRAHPQAAQMPAPDGFLPLHLAVESNLHGGAEEIVHEVLAAYPAAAELPGEAEHLSQVRSRAARIGQHAYNLLRSDSHTARRLWRLPAAALSAQRLQRSLLGDGDRSTPGGAAVWGALIDYARAADRVHVDSVHDRISQHGRGVCHYAASDAEYAASDAEYAASDALGRLQVSSDTPAGADAPAAWVHQFGNPDTKHGHPGAAVLVEDGVRPYVPGYSGHSPNHKDKIGGGAWQPTTPYEIGKNAPTRRAHSRRSRRKAAGASAGAALASPARQNSKVPFAAKARAR